MHLGSVIVMKSISLVWKKVTVFVRCASHARDRVSFLHDYTAFMCV